MSNRVELRDYAHPMDLMLSQRILNFPLIKKILDIVFEEKLDTINYYAYQSSCIRLSDKHPAVTAFQNGKSFFNIDTEANVFVVRNYNFDVKVVGYTEPVILVSSRLIEENNGFLLKERLAAAASVIAAEHHKLDFLLWIYENCSGIINLPILSTALTALICEWQRCRQYTTDRAFLLYTNDYTLAKMNILYGLIPYEYFLKFDFNMRDTYYQQVEEFYRKDNILDISSSVMSLLQHEIWIPARYKELRDFYQGGVGCGMDM